MQTIFTTQPWQPLPLNQSGIRRLKITSSNNLFVFPSVGLVPQSSFKFYEFIFPSDLSCVASVQKQKAESGSIFWQVQISFSLPHFLDSITEWVVTNAQTQWILIAEDYNGTCRAFGGTPDGLDFAFQATTGSGPRDANPMVFTFSGNQLAPFFPLLAYEDSDIFPNDAAFSYGFSIGFNS
ncbi:hypothetical protein [Dyadobacter crusticola]|uniref:hypothetical protein n=1 Tax=Dyadobacter crusticola TaxID=292407 RepID=UPI0004E178E6|nr:hypothetical protein [Dyadobacter crusticola]